MQKKKNPQTKIGFPGVTSMEDFMNPKKSAPKKSLKNRRKKSGSR